MQHLNWKPRKHTAQCLVMTSLASRSRRLISALQNWETGQNREDTNISTLTLRKTPCIEKSVVSNLEQQRPMNTSTQKTSLPSYDSRYRHTPYLTTNSTTPKINNYINMKQNTSSTSFPTPPFAIALQKVSCVLIAAVRRDFHPVEHHSKSDRV